MELFAKYAVNKSEGEVQLIEGRVKIPVGGWKGLTTREVEHDDIIYAIRRDWIELTNHEPRVPQTPEKPKLQFVKAEDLGSVEPPAKVVAPEPVVETEPTTPVVEKIKKTKVK